MVKSVEVKNFKSISDLKIELGRVNVFIGENGSGKSNILEAVAFGAAASANKLDKEFLASRGMRVPEAELVRNGFDKSSLKKDVFIYFEVDTNDNSNDVIRVKYQLRNDNGEFSKWEEVFKDTASNVTLQLMRYLFTDFPKEADENLLATIKSGFGESFVDEFVRYKKSIKDVVKDEISKLTDDITKDLIFKRVDNFYSHPLVQKFKIYAPENTFLRKFEDEEAGDPLGIKGEGLFRLLRYFQNHDDKNYINAIKDALSALDWFDNFEIPNSLYVTERRLSIIDRFIDPSVSISQNSANEGFLFILFYISLFVSEDTPPFFAVDNVDASFNPKLCKHITQILVNAAKKSSKQALFTTHNPFILDGLDLTDDEQRLFVVYRTQQGHTVAKRVEPNDRKMKLSEQWMNGFLGGLPKNF